MKKGNRETKRNGTKTKKEKTKREKEEKEEKNIEDWVNAIEQRARFQIYEAIYKLAVIVPRLGNQTVL